jgi:hypothetical protein
MAGCNLLRLYIFTSLFGITQMSLKCANVEQDTKIFYFILAVVTCATKYFIARFCILF